MATGGIANVMHYSESNHSVSVASSRRADTCCSSLGFPRTIRDRMFLLHPQHRPFHHERRDDLSEVQVPPVDFHVFDPASYRKSIHSSLADQPWHHTDQCDRVWRRQQACWTLASRDYEYSVLDLLRTGYFLQLWYLPHNVSRAHLLMPPCSGTNVVTDGRRKPSQSPK